MITAAARDGREQWGRLLRSTAAKGWGPALFEHNKQAAAEGWPTPEDERSADWKFLVRWAPNGRALVFGCGWGVVPIALSPCFATVHAIDHIPERAALLAVRAREQGIRNLQPVAVADRAALPFAGGSFDFVSVGDAASELTDDMPARELVATVRALLRAGGTAQFSLGNRWGFDHMLGRSGGGGGPRRQSLAAYLRILREGGFSNIRAYAPFPRHQGTPMFYVPLTGSAPMNFFLRNLAVLFDAVSPEVKRRHAVEYGVAKLGVRAALLFKGAPLASLLVPGFCIFAQAGSAMDHS